MSQLLKSGQDAFTDLDDNLITQDAPLTDVVIKAISRNAKFANTRIEYIYMGFWKNGDTLPPFNGTPIISPVDGYQYSTSEVYFDFRLMATRHPGALFVSGQQLAPTMADGQPGNLHSIFVADIDNNTGIVNIVILLQNNDGHLFVNPTPVSPWADSALPNSVPGAMKVYAICQRGRGTLQMAVQPAFYDVADGTLCIGQPLKDANVLYAVSHNAKFAAVRSEVIFAGYYQDNDTVPLPRSPVDNYQYLPGEVRFIGRLVSTRAPERTSFVAGQQNLPTISGNQVALLYYPIYDIDDLTGVVSTRTSYYKPDGNETIPGVTTGALGDGIVKVFCMCQRQTVAAPSGAISNPSPITGGVPTPQNWVLSGNLSGDLRLAFAVPLGADYASGALSVLCDLENLRSSLGATALAADLAPTDVQMDVVATSGLFVGQEITINQHGVPDTTIPAEIIRITGPGALGEVPSSTTLDIDRAQRGTAAQQQHTGDNVYTLTEIKLAFSLPDNYSTDHPTSDPADPTQYFVYRFRPGRMRIMWAGLVIFDSSGVPSGQLDTPFQLFIYGNEPNVDGTLPGLRVANGDLFTIPYDGPLEVNIFSRTFIFPPGRSLGPVYGIVAGAPSGAPITVQIYANGATWGPPKDIPIGEFGTGIIASGAQYGNVDNVQMKIVFTSVGSIDPGTDFTLYIPA